MFSNHSWIIGVVSDLQALARDRLRGLTDSASWIVGVASFTVSDWNETHDIVFREILQDVMMTNILFERLIKSKSSCWTNADK